MGKTYFLAGVLVTLVYTLFVQRYAYNLARDLVCDGEEQSEVETLIQRTEETHDEAQNTVETVDCKDYSSEPKFNSVFFLKVHKTGSTTVSKYLLEYCRRHGLVTLDAPGDVYMNRPNKPNGKKCDAIVNHHLLYNQDVVNSYLKTPPDLTLASVRLPLQRQISWFRQKNADYEMPGVLASAPECQAPNSTLLNHFDNTWQKQDSLWNILREPHRREEMGLNPKAVIDQFDFVFVQEVLAESMESLCAQTGVRLCACEEPPKRNEKPKDSCVEAQLLRYRSEQIMDSLALDLLVYEEALKRIMKYHSNGIPPHCRCTNAPS